MRFLKTKVLVSVMALGIAAMTASANAQEQKFVAITAIVEHPALDNVREGLIEGLASYGYVQDKNLKIKYQNAQGNTGTAAQIARQFVGDNPDVIVAIATPSAQAVVATSKKVPVVFAGVTEPVAAQLLKAQAPSDSNVTGTSDALPLEQQVDLMLKVVPNAKRIGMVYNPGEANSAVVVKYLKEALPKRGLQLVEAAAPRTVDVGSAARSLVGKVDMIYSSTDNNVIAAYESLVKVANESKIPLVASDTDSVKRGGIAALGVDYKLMGLQTAKLVKRIFEGEKPGAMPYETSNKFNLLINLKAAKLQGVTLSEDLIKTATEIIK